MPKITEKLPPKTPADSSALYAMIAERPASVGDLVDYANGLPRDWVVAAASAIALSIADDYEKERHRSSRRRRLIILGALLTRLAFEIEKIPADRSEII